MSVLLKYLLHDMINQYRRTLLVLITLILSSASILASAAISGTMVELGTNEWRAEYGYSDISISATPASQSRFFNEYAIDPFSGQFEYAVYKVSSPAKLETPSGTVYVNAAGYNMEQLCRMVPMHFYLQENRVPFEGDKVIISKKTAEKRNIALGDILTISINGNKHALIVCAIAYAEGPFAFETDTPTLLLPYGKMQACIGELGHADAIYIKLKNLESKGRMIRLLSDAYQGYRVNESYSEDNLRLQANRTAVPFVFMSVLLCFMAVYVLFTLFKGSVESRQRLMGLFRAVGATRQDTWTVLLIESLLYGVAGGLLGWGAGAGILSVMIHMLNSGTAYQYIALSIRLPQLLLSLASAVATSLCGALTCLVSEGNASVCQQIRGITAAKAEKPGTVWGLALAAVSVAVVLLWQSENGLTVYISCVVCMLAGMVLLSPALYARAAALLGLMFRRRTGMFRISILNIKNHKDFAAAATIVSIIVSTIIVISTISYSDTTGTNIYYARKGYNIELSMNGLNNQTINMVRQMKGVDDVCGNYYSGTVEVSGQSIAIYRVQGISPEHGAGFENYPITSSRTDPVGDLESGRNILLTQTLKNIYHVNEGDSMTLKLFGYDGRYREVTYRIFGFFKDYHTKLGRVAWISQQNFETDFSAREYSCLYIRAGDARATADMLSAAFEKQQATIQLVEDNKQETEQESAKIINAMGFISDLALASGILGIVNITLLSFMRRKREIGIYYAMGMTTGDILKATAWELFLSGLLGSVSGTLMGLAITILALPRLIFALQIALHIYPSLEAVWIGLPTGLLVSTISSVLCLFFLNRSSPMDGLKQEE